MKKRKLLFWTLGILLVAAMIVGAWFYSHSGSDNYQDKYQGVDLLTNVGQIVRENTYAAYLEAHTGAPQPQLTLPLPVSAPVEMENAQVWDSYQGQTEVLWTGENSRVTWQVEVPEEGMYYLRFLYCSVASRGINAERSLLINGESPFRGADSQTFTRFWTDDPEGKGKTDNRGNQIRPAQVEVFRWEEKFASDNNNGYEPEPYQFYFPAGTNQVTLEGISEPLALKELSLVPVSHPTDYAGYLADCPGEPVGQTLWSRTIQGEDAALRSDPSLYATYDRSAPNTVPYSLSTTTLNIIGGNAWSVSGQRITWQVEVPEDGWYNLAFKGRQNYNRGQAAIRALKIDGQTPFQEAREIEFQYSNGWQLQSIGNQEGDFRFYLTQGTHDISLEVALGQIGEPVRKLEDSVYRLNQIYRQLLVIMGRTPDKFRDYHLLDTYPELPQAMLLESQRLYEIADEIIAISGGKSSYTGTITVLADLLEDFSKDPEELIKRRLATFRDDITALGTTMQNLCQSQLDIDYLVIKTPAESWPVDKANVFQYIWHELCSFGTSFTTDYDTLGDVYQGEETIQVWILTGRDQANVLKTIIDDSFTPAYGIGVNLKLVDSGAVLSAVAAGTGPDILLSAGQGEPVNYALRNAVEDLTQFPDCQEVLKRFHESAYVPFLYQDGVYALPETQSFNVLFYREDILQELGLEVPETWEDLENMLNVLQEANMEVGLPDIMRAQRTGQTADLSGFYAMMFQNGCQLYDQEGTRALLDQEGAIRAFEDYSEFYTSYDLPKDYNLVDRFRSGEMPIGIADFGTQNTLAVFAPELKGLWSFALIPGTRQADGTVDHSVLSNSSCSMLLKNDDPAAKARCWEFLKWWTSTETQARFGREMECLMGSAARYATANLEAFQQLSWSTEQLEILNAQRECAQANREVAGGYYTGRHIVNAVRKVVNDQTAPRETLLDYNQTINDEIQKKRSEFGLEEGGLSIREKE